MLKIFPWSDIEHILFIHCQRQNLATICFLSDLRIERGPSVTCLSLVFLGGRAKSHNDTGSVGLAARLSMYCARLSVYCVEYVCISKSSCFQKVGFDTTVASFSWYLKKHLTPGEFKCRNWSDAWSWLWRGFQDKKWRFPAGFHWIICTIVS